MVLPYPYPYPYPTLCQRTRDNLLKSVGVDVMTSRDYRMAARDDPRLLFNIWALTDSSRDAEFAVLANLNLVKLIVHVGIRAEAHPTDPHLDFDARDKLRCVLPYPNLIHFFEWLLTLPLAA